METSTGSGLEYVETIADYLRENLAAIESRGELSAGGFFARDTVRDCFVAIPGGLVARVFARRDGAARWRVESVEFLATIPGGFHFAGDDESRAACREIAAAIEELDRRNSRPPPKRNKPRRVAAAWIDDTPERGNQNR
jgi:hypothetical protein